MQIILVYWQIKKGMEKDFRRYWNKTMKPTNPKGFYGEILTKSFHDSDPTFNTYSITDKNYSTFINIGFWESTVHFKKSIGAFIREAKASKLKGKMKYTVVLEKFEFKLRERVMLKPIGNHGDILKRLKKSI